MGDPLKERDLKRTKCRMALLSLLENTDAPMTAEGIYQSLSGSMHVSLSTVYRTAATLSEKGLLLKNVGVDGLTYYQLNNHRHCHYLICTGCNALLPIDGCPLHKLEEDLTASTGYQITGHHLEFFGLCPKCAAKSRGE